MKATIHGDREAENGELRVGLTVTDTNDIEHGIELGTDGTVYKHGQDGYSDHPSERTMEENEHVRQARRYAKWRVYRERGYETMARHENPDCLVAAMIAISKLSEETVDDHFGDLRAQLNSHYDDSTLELPFEDAHPDDVFIYRKDLYLSPDPLAIDPPLADQYDDLAIEMQEEAGAVPTESDGVEHRLQELLASEDRLESELPDFELDAVSDVYALHTDGKTEQTTEPASALDRAQDARIELPPMAVDQFGLFHVLLVANLSSQVRDRYQMMGERPPAAFQHQGYGTYRGTVKQQINDMYDRCYLFTESVDNWRPPVA